jgi:hypothetical protein
MKINEILAEAGKTYNSGSKSALGSFLRGAGMSQGADAADAYATAQQLNPQSKKSRVKSTRAADAKAAADEAKRQRFIAVIKQQADRQGSISMTDIGKRIPKQGEYADPTRRREAVNNIAQELQQQGVTVTNAKAIPQSTTATAPLPTIGGIGPNDPRYAALAAKTKNAPATPVR